jgi:hypothetical protein
MTLIHKYSCLAREYQTKDAWTIVAEHYLECLRLNKNDNNGLRFALPFVLLGLNRDEDAVLLRPVLDLEPRTRERRATTQGIQRGRLDLP